MCCLLLSSVGLYWQKALPLPGPMGCRAALIHLEVFDSPVPRGWSLQWHSLRPLRPYASLQGAAQGCSALLSSAGLRCPAALGPMGRPALLRFLKGAAPKDCHCCRTLLLHLKGCVRAGPIDWSL